MHFKDTTAEAVDSQLRNLINERAEGLTLDGFDELLSACTQALEAGHGMVATLHFKRVIELGVNFQDQGGKLVEKDRLVARQHTVDHIPLFAPYSKKLAELLAEEVGEGERYSTAQDVRVRILWLELALKGGLPERLKG